MCGDLDEDEEVARLEDQLYARFVMHARMMLKDAGASQGRPADLGGYMEKLFNDALSRSVRDSEELSEGQRYERLSVQPVVFARLAGLLAGHLARGEDPLHKVMEALMLGYSEAETMDREHEQHHHHGDVYVHDHQH
jgi:hypothetical protein